MSFEEIDHWFAKKADGAYVFCIENLQKACVLIAVLLIGGPFLLILRLFGFIFYLVWKSTHYILRGLGYESRKNIFISGSNNSAVLDKRSSKNDESR